MRFLDRLSAEERDALMARMTPRRYGPGEVLLAHQDDGSDVFFVIEGSAQAALYSDEGKAVAYRRIEVGEIFGELSAVDHQPRSANVTAESDLVAGRMTQAQFRNLVETMPSFTWALLEHLAALSREMTARIFEYSTMLVRERLIAELVRMAEAAGIHDGAAQIKPAPTHFNLATRISTHREAVAREMSRLAKSGLVSKKAGILHVHDVDALKHEAFGNTQLG